MPWRQIKISKAFYESLRDLNPLHAAEQFNGNLLCIAGSKDFSAPNVEIIDSVSPSHNKAKEIIPEADHIFNVSGGNVTPSVIQKLSDWTSVMMEEARLSSICKL